ncbi:MAG TPA: hypothetical protein VF783_22130 [Terriglobales bacterium]
MTKGNASAVWVSARPSDISGEPHPKNRFAVNVHGASRQFRTLSSNFLALMKMKFGYFHLEPDIRFLFVLENT